jgi:hypothetical protein
MAAKAIDRYKIKKNMKSKIYEIILSVSTNPNNSLEFHSLRLTSERTYVHMSKKSCVKFGDESPSGSIVIMSISIHRKVTSSTLG